MIIYRQLIMTMHKNVRKHLSEKLLTDHTLIGVVYAAYNYYSWV